jgi:hypothetical protein
MFSRGRSWPAAIEAPAELREHPDREFGRLHADQGAVEAVVAAAVVEDVVEDDVVGLEVIEELLGSV